MANKKLQYQATSKAPFIAPVTVAVFTAFSTFSPPQAAKVSVAVEAAGVVNTPIKPAISPAVFSQFSQPQVVTAVKAFEQPNVSNIPYEPPYTPPTFFGFSTFIPVLHVKLPVCVDFANFAHLTPADPPVQELNDGGYVKKKRKPTKRELDPYAEEAETKRLRREAIENAIFGPPVEYTLPPLAFPVENKPLPPNLGDLPQIVLAAQQAQKQEALRKAALEQEEEDEIINILREIL